MKKLKSVILLSFLAISSSIFGQEIKTKVSEEVLGSKPTQQPEEKFEEARIFVYLGGGVGYRTGTIISGFLASDGKDEPKFSRSADSDSPFRNGLLIDFGGRYFFPENFGLGLKTNLFMNTRGFKEKGTINDVDHSTYILYGMLEGLYRKYFSDEKKEGFIYGSLGIGMGYINQTQKYRYNRTTDVTQAFFAARPAIGVNLPLYDIFHGYAEVGYGFSQGTIADGTLSLSQVQFSLGLHFRINPF